MSYPTRALFAVVVALAVAAVPVQAAGSKTKSEDKPGVADYNAGVKLMKKGKFVEAEKKFEAALAENESFAEAHNNLAYSLRKQGPEHHDEALGHYNRAIELDPYRIWPRNNLGFVYLQMGRYKKAVDELEAAVQLSPVKAYMFNNLGLAHEKLGEPHRAFAVAHVQAFIQRLGEPHGP